MKWALVIPSNRPDNLADFFTAWGPTFEKHNVVPFVVHDSPDTWATLPSFIPRRSDMIRSWGIYQAWETSGFDAIVSLDDDVRPDPTIDIFNEYEKQFYTPVVVSNVFNVAEFTSTPEVVMRGYPRDKMTPRLVAVQYGGWGGVPDYGAFDAPFNTEEKTFAYRNQPIPVGTGVTGCIMNTAWLADFSPIMWQLPLLDGRYNRYGDIWSGFFIKKVLDVCDYGLTISGRASVIHTKASDYVNNMLRETSGLHINNRMWDIVNARGYTPGTNYDIIDVYVQVTDDASNAFAAVGDTEYRDHFLRSRDEWVELFIA